MLYNSFSTTALSTNSSLHDKHVIKHATDLRQKSGNKKLGSLKEWQSN